MDCEKYKCLNCNYSNCGHCKDCIESEDNKVVINCQWYKDIKLD